MPRSARSTTRIPARFPKPAGAKAPAVKADPAADFAAVQPQVRQALVSEMARGKAVKAASDLAYALYEGKVTRASLESFLASRKLKTESLAPFTNEAGPSEFGGSREIATAAFELNCRPVLLRGDSQPQRRRGPDLEGTPALPLPALSEVREQVVATTPPTTRSASASSNSGGP